MACPTFPTHLEAVKAHFRYGYIRGLGLTDATLEAAIEAVECSVDALSMQARCPKIYQPWLAPSVIDYIITNVKAEGATPGEPDLNTPTVAGAVDPVLYLKKKTTLDVTCEWAEVKQCLDCDQEGVKSDVDRWIQLCNAYHRPSGNGSNFFRRDSCRPGCFNAEKRPIR